MAGQKQPCEAIHCGSHTGSTPPLIPLANPLTLLKRRDRGCVDDGWGRLRCPGSRHSHLALSECPHQIINAYFWTALTSNLTFTPKKRAISSISASIPSFNSGASCSNGSTITTRCFFSRLLFQVPTV